jgi:hypothetical protein
VQLGLGWTALERRPAVAQAFRWSVADARGGIPQARFDARVKHATTVELASDLTGWRPIPMGRQRRSSNEFTVSLPASPGVHRVRIRIDGGPWSVPPGVSLEEGDFGAVGVILLESATPLM